MISGNRISVEDVRSKFPALSTGFAYLENAGGSQVPKGVAEAVAHHMLHDYVQLGAGYPQSERATQIVTAAHQFATDPVGATGDDPVLLGASTTSLIHMVAKAYGEKLEPGDEVIIAESNHEANAGAWNRLEALGMVVKIWPLNPETFVCELADLAALLTPRTRLVAMPHVSNILGKLEDVTGACRLAHEVGAKVFVDGVAFAPHRPIDVEALGADYYVLSVYKVYGPHMAVLYAKRPAIAELQGPNHDSIPNNYYPGKWEPGGVSYEACAGFVAVKAYLAFLAGSDYEGRPTVETAFKVMQRLERPVEERLRNWLATRQDLKTLGPKTSTEDSVATISFTHNKIPSDDISRWVDKANIGIRHGNMYATRLLGALNIPLEPGVVRVSAVHYNTVEEIDRLINMLEVCLDR